MGLGNALRHGPTQEEERPEQRRAGSIYIDRASHMVPAVYTISLATNSCYISGSGALGKPATNNGVSRS